MNIESMKRAVAQVQVNRRQHLGPALSRLKTAVRMVNRNTSDDKEILQLRRRLEAEKEKHQNAISNIELLEETLGGVRFLVKEKKAAKKRRRKRAKETHVPRGKGGEGIEWDKYEVCRSIDEKIKKAKKDKSRLTQAQASASVIKNYNAEYVRIDADIETLCRYYRNWKKQKRKRKAD